MLGNRAVGVYMREGAVMAVAKGVGAAIATIVGTASREHGDRDSTIVVSSRCVTGMLPPGIDILYDCLCVGSVIWPDGGSSTSG